MNTLQFENYQGLSAKASDAEKRGAWTEAAVIYEQMRVQHPDREAGWLGGARMLGETGRLDEMDALLSEGMKRLPTDFPLCREYARLAMRRGDHAEALVRWQAASRCFPEVPTAFSGQVAALAGLGRFEEADDLAAAQLARFPKSMSLHFEYAQVAERSHRPQEAFTRWQAAKRLFPEQPRCHLGMAYALCNQRQREQAQALLADALRALPDHPQLLDGASHVAQLRQDWPAALELVDRLLARVPESKSAFERRLVALRALGRHADAEQQLLPGWREMIKAAAAQKARPGSTGKAEARAAAVQRALAQPAVSAQAVMESCDVLIGRGDYDEAEGILEVEFERHRHSLGLAARWGQMANRLKNWPEAVQRWRDLDARFPGTVQILAGLAEAHWALRDEAALRSVLDRLLAVAPDSPAAAILYARLELRQNRAADAVARLVRAQSANPDNIHIRAELTDARMVALLESADTEQVPHVTASSSGEDSEAANLFSLFESLGSGCEFGLVQRRAGVEPIGLLRWASITAQGLTEALEKRFEGLGDVRTTELRPVNDTYLLLDRVYAMGMQTFISPTTEAAETLLPKLCRRQKFLARVLMENLQENNRIPVFKSPERLSHSAIQRLWEAIRSFGCRSLLIVQLTDEENPPGTLRVPEAGLMMGTVGWFSNYESDTTSWTRLCEAARNVWVCDQATVAEPVG